MDNFLLRILFASTLHYAVCVGQLTSSVGRFTFCSGESVVISCSLSSPLHTWDIGTTVNQRVLVPSQLDRDIQAGDFTFRVTRVEGGNITISTVTFMPSTDVVSNGTVVQCSDSVDGLSEVRLTQTVQIFGRTGPTQMANIMNPEGDYTSLMISIIQPDYGHECVTGYNVTFDEGSKNTATSTLTIPGLNLCQTIYTFTIFAVTFSGEAGEAISVSSPVPNFSGLGRVFGLSNSTHTLSWNRPRNASDGCISGYTVEWPSGSSVFVQGDVQEVALSTLSERSNRTLPFCVNVPTTTSPHVGVIDGPLTDNQNSPATSLLYQNPALPTPVLTIPVDTSFDKTVTWQSLSSLDFSDNITQIVGIYDQSSGQCIGSEVTGTSQLISTNCSSAGTTVVYCVQFKYFMCTTTSTLQRQLPAVNSSAIAETTSTNMITLSIILTDINGLNCMVNQLTVRFSLSLETVELFSSSQTFSPGESKVAFSNLTPNTAYEYRITVGDGVTEIASYSGQSSTKQASSTTVIIAVVVVVMIIITLVTVVILITAVVFTKKKRDRSDAQQPEHLYEQVEDSKLATRDILLMEENVAYGQFNKK